MKSPVVGLVLAATVALASATPAQTKSRAPAKDSRGYEGPPTKQSITSGDLKTRLYIFADDSMRGRATGTPDNLRGTAYIERELKKLGLIPAGDNGTYHQDVPVIIRAVEKASHISIGGRSFALGTDFVARDNGFGMRPIAGATAIYGGAIGDTLKMLPRAQAAGKVVVLTLPTGWSVNRGSLNDRYFSAAAIAVATLDSMPRESLQAFLDERSADLKNDESPRPRPSFVYESSALARAMFGGRDLRTLPVGTVGQQLSGTVDYSAEPVPARNVVAILRGSDPKLRGQYVAIGAHNDHLRPATVPVDHDSIRSFQLVVRPAGVEGPTTKPSADEWHRINAMIDSLRKVRPPRLDSIYNGADDDGSGSMAVLEIAEAFAKAKVRPKRSILFVWHTGEELGLYGSQYFTDHPTVPRDSIVAQLNIDMVGRGGLRDMVRADERKRYYGSPTYVQVIGSRRLSSELGDILDAVNAAQPTRLDFDYRLDANGEPHQYYCRSDHYNYARYGIPIAFFFDGGHADYHELTDEPQYIDYVHYSRIVNMVYSAAIRVANLGHRVVVDKPKPDPNGRCVQ